jgi:hypothetical protein
MKSATEVEILIGRTQKGLDMTMSITVQGGMKSATLEMITETGGAVE